MSSFGALNYNTNPAFPDYSSLNYNNLVPLHAQQPNSVPVHDPSLTNYDPSNYNYSTQNLVDLTIPIPHPHSTLSVSNLTSTANSGLTTPNNFWPYFNNATPHVSLGQSSNDPVFLVNNNVSNGFGTYNIPNTISHYQPHQPLSLVSVPYYSDVGPSNSSLAAPNNNLSQSVSQTSTIYSEGTIHTNAIAPEASHRGVDYNQRSTSTTQIPKTVRNAYTNASLTHAKPPTSGELSVDTVNQNYTRDTTFLPAMSAHMNHPTLSVDPTTSVHHLQSDQTNLFPSLPRSPIPALNLATTSTTPSSIPYSTETWRLGRQLCPAPHLWARTDDGKFRCCYVGPINPYGCTSILQDIRSLGRHMKERHAIKEIPLPIPNEEKVALRGMPRDLLIARVVCPLEDGELRKCGYYREHGERWEVETIKRKAKVLELHKRLHDDGGEPVIVKKRKGTRVVSLKSRLTKKQS
ncbi:hypothetical protein Clacol_002346 [Clathrus columnatus]|uniref:Uncharacterized protein n=1 Tax=Clathrus columnatus TaxID=1419009 RepID=A0AAV5A4L6_9AGAM|nr:hypothetical protein Clacol_002346 [Clathrus columnatus]